MEQHELLQQLIPKYRKKIEIYQFMIDEWEQELKEEIMKAIRNSELEKEERRSDSTLGSR